MQILKEKQNEIMASLKKMRSCFPSFKSLPAIHRCSQKRTAFGAYAPSTWNTRKELCVCLLIGPHKIAIGYKLYLINIWGFLQTMSPVIADLNSLYRHWKCHILIPMLHTKDLASVVRHSACELLNVSYPLQTGSKL